eukprot:scaffold3309_cov276-Pinguiococcus_pyrenoidosus.AAC.3
MAGLDWGPRSVMQPYFSDGVAFKPVFGTGWLHWLTSRYLPARTDLAWNFKGARGSTLSESFPRGSHESSRPQKRIGSRLQRREEADGAGRLPKCLSQFRSWGFSGCHLASHLASYMDKPRHEASADEEMQTGDLEGMLKPAAVFQIAAQPSQTNHGLHSAGLENHGGLASRSEASFLHWGCGTSSQSFSGHSDGISASGMLTKTQKVQVAFSLSSFPENLHGRLRALDLDSDGYIERSEIAAAAIALEQSRHENTTLRRINGVLL